MAEEEKRMDAHSGWYTFGRALGRFLLRTICPTRYYHAERLQGDAPFIVIANHTSWMDPVAIGGAIRRYEVVFLGKSELVKNKFAGWLLNKLHMIVVDRHKSDMEAMRACLRALKQGCILGIFPEGTRYHEGVMEQTESGVGLIALRSGVPVMPVYIRGRFRPFRRTRVYCGEAIPTEDLRAQGVNAATSAALMQRITETYRTMIADAEAEEK